MFVKILYLEFLGGLIVRVSLALLLGMVTFGWLPDDKSSSKLT